MPGKIFIPTIYGCSLLSNIVVDLKATRMGGFFVGLYSFKCDGCARASIRHRFADDPITVRHSLGLWV
jgi:hypothetical protein